MNSTEYQGKPSAYFKFGRREVLSFIPTNTKSILEIGCGEGEFAANLKAERSVHVTGIEPFEAAARIADSRLDRVLTMDVNQGLLELQNQLFDCIVCNDVLEHLADPWDILKRLRPLIAQGGVLVASLPNMRFMPVLKDLVLKSEWHYTDAGVMDRTHLRFFTKKSMHTLFQDAGYRVLEMKGINAIKFPWKFALLNIMTLGSLEDARYLQFVSVVKKANL